tara:strand:+ start:452 stop:793 length:342 start_codon:yes stop_codon:yes gene_type:complete
MIWPPTKAWTSKFPIEGKLYFVAINYGGELLNRWVILMSVIDSSVVVKVSWSQLVDSSDWESGWGEINYVESYKLVNNKSYEKNTEISYPSNDSGLTIPISKDIIRPWFDKIK